MSEAENLLDYQIRVLGLPEPKRQYKFHPTRKWMFDKAWDDIMLAVEIEGGVFIQGRHTRGKGFVGDCEKYNAAVEMGYRVLRFPAHLIKTWEPVLQIARVIGHEVDLDSDFLKNMRDKGAV